MFCYTGLEGEKNKQRQGSTKYFNMLGFAHHDDSEMLGADIPLNVCSSLSLLLLQKLQFIGLIGETAQHS